VRGRQTPYLRRRGIWEWHFTEVCLFGSFRDPVGDDLSFYEVAGPFGLTQSRLIVPRALASIAFGLKTGTITLSGTKR
jgi:hypothetical protein